ncbi:MAG: hypothetical protein AMXMBFR7_51880 [Planctomycetota bacterium]
MSELVDPNRLVSLADAAKETGFHPKYLCLLAAKGKLKAWRIGNMWATLPEYVEEYVKTRKPPGRPAKPKKRRRKTDT